MNKRAWLAGFMTAAAVLLGGSAAYAGLAARDWPMFRHDEKHTGRTALPGPPVADPGPPALPALRWFQGGLFDPQELGHRPPGPQGIIWSSPAQAADGTGARKAWYFHDAQWTLNSVPIGLRQLRSEAPLTTAMQSLPAPAGVVPAGGSVTREFATSAAINFVSVGDADRRSNLEIRNLDPSRDDGVMPASTVDSPWRFSFLAIADASTAVQVIFHVEAFPQGSPGTRRLLFSTSPRVLIQGRRRYEVTHQSDAINLTTLFPTVPGQRVGIMVRVELRNTTGVDHLAFFEYDGASRSRMVTPILEPAVRVGSQDGSFYAANGSTGNVMWAYWTGWGAVAESQVRSSPAIDDAGTSYFGVEQSPGGGQGFTTGRAFAVNNDGSLRWVYPSSRRTFFLRSQTDPADPGARRRLMTPGAGSTPDVSTFAQTGTSLDFTQFTAGATSSPAPKPDAMTQFGWIAKVNLQDQVMIGGRFKIDLGYRADGTGNPPSALLWYRISKVGIDGSGDVVYGQELIGWTSAGQDQILAPSAVGQFFITAIETEPVDEIMFSAGEWLYLELGIQQVRAPAGTSGWRIVVEDPVDGTSLTTSMVSDGFIGAVSSSPVLSDGNLLYFGDGNGTIHAVDSGATDQLEASDMVLWTLSLGSGEGIELSSPALDPTVGRNRIYVGTSAGTVLAVDALTSSIAWRFPAVGNIGTVLSSPAVAENGDIYVGSDDGHVYAIAPDGTLRWQYPTVVANPLGPVRNSPGISRNGRVVYFGATDNPNTPALNEAGMHAVRVAATGAFDAYLGQVGGGGVQSSPAVSTGGLRRQVFFRSDSAFSGSIPAPDRYRLGLAGAGAQCVNLEKDLTTLPAAGEPEPSPQRGWLTDPLFSGDRLEPGLWTFSIQHAADDPQPRTLYFRISRVGVDVGGSVIHRRVLTGGANGWSAAAQALRPGVYYFHVEGGGSLARGVVPDSPEQTLSGDPGGGSIELGRFITADGDPDATKLCGGQWQFTFTASASTAGTARISFDVLSVAPGGGETLLFSTPASDPLADTPREFTIATSQLGINISPDDRLAVAVRASGTGTAIFRYEGSTNTRLAGPIPAVLRFSADVSGTTFQTDDRLYVELAVPSPDTVTWSVIDWLQSFVATAPFAVGAETVFYGSNDGLVRAVRMFFAADDTPTGWEGNLTWLWPPLPRRAYVSSPAIAQAITPGVAADPALYIGGGDNVLVCLGPAGAIAPNLNALPELPVPEGGLLRVTKSVDKRTASTGDTVTFTIRVHNPSLPDPALSALGATLTDVVPGGLNYQSNTGGGVYNPATSTIAWNLGTVEAQSSETVTFTADVTATGIDPDATPRVEISHADFSDFAGGSGDSDGDYAPVIDDRTTRWGEYLYARVTGRGQPTDIGNQAQADWAYGASSFMALSNASTVAVGWGHRYQLEFVYDPANDPAPGVRPENQVPGGPSLSYSVRMELAGAGERTGKAEEAYDPAATGPQSGKYITVFKIRIAPRAYPYGPGAASVAQQPNRPWTPYYWKVFVQQASGVSGQWGPSWGRNDDPTMPRNGVADPPNRDPGPGSPDQTWDLRVANPLQTSPDDELPISGAGLLNAGSTSPAAGMGLTNRSRFALVGMGAAARNVVRWAGVDLGQSTAPFNALAFPGVPYDTRKESYLPASSLQFTPPEFTSLASGETVGVSVRADVPRYLSPGVYVAPQDNLLLGTTVPAAPLLLYVDLNGNGSWDPGEGYHEQQNIDWTGTYEPLSFTAGVARQPLMRMASETLDLGRAPVGKDYATVTFDSQTGMFRLDGAVPVNVENVGNVPLTATVPSTSELKRADSASDLLPMPGSLVRLWHEDDSPSGVVQYFAGSPMLLAKTPVGGLVPLTFTARATVGLGIARPSPPAQEWNLPIPADQPSGLYSGVLRTAESGATGADGTAAIGVQIVESRETSQLGADIAPAAGFSGLDTLNVFWSSNRKADGSLPGVADPMHLYYMSLIRDVQNFSYTRSQVQGPYAPQAVDPMLIPQPGTWLRHIGAGYVADSTAGAQLLAWAGSTLRGAPGQPRYDNRLLWREWPPGELFTDWNGNGQWDPGEPFTDLNGNGVHDGSPTPYDNIYDDPPVALRNRPDLMDGVFKSRPRFAKLETVANLYQTAWLVWGQGQPQPSQMVLMELVRTRPTETDPWSEWLVVRKNVLHTPAGLSDASDPSGFAYPQGHANYDGLLHVAFAGRSYLHGNTDIYYGRYLTQPEPFQDTNANGRYDLGELFTDADRNGLYDPDPLAEEHTGGLVPFPRVRGEVAEPLTSRSFAARHIEWVTLAGFWPVIYVDNSSGQPVPIYDPIANPPQFDRRSGRYVIDNASYLLADGATPVGGRRLEFDAAAGAVYFLEAPNRVTIDYAPRVMRLTKHQGTDVMPTAFIETYRYLENGVRQPSEPFDDVNSSGWYDQGEPFTDLNGNGRYDGFIPRLWVFWVRAGTVGLGPRLFFKTYRRAPDPDDAQNSGWLEEIRSNAQQWATLNGLTGVVWPVDVGERAVQVDHPVNESGLAAVKDPRYPGVWLLWSSTRSVATGVQTDPTVPGSAYAHNADIYYEPFDPAMPE